MHLTAEHISRTHRVVEDSGPLPGQVMHSAEDYDAWVERMIRSDPAPDQPFRLFAYGSLIWKPEIVQVGEMPGRACGWHRSFCFRILRHRGSEDCPGLMMALDRGGSCRGVLYDLPRAGLAQALGKLFRREFTVKPGNGLPRWIRVETATGVVPALTFVMNRSSPFYVGRQTPEAVARILARACGHWGSGAEYLFNTVCQLEARGIRDGGLWQLQRLVAAEIDRLS